MCLKLSPVEGSEVDEVLVVPLCWPGGEGELEAAGCRVASPPVPTQAGPGVERLLGWGGPGPGRTGPVTLPDGVTASYRGSGVLQWSEVHIKTL